MFLVLLTLKILTPNLSPGFGSRVESFAALQQLACLTGGTFALSGSTVRGLCEAFSSVSSTITAGSNKWVLADGAEAWHNAGLLKSSVYSMSIHFL